MPKVASFALNKALVSTAKTGKKLQSSTNVGKQIAGKALSTIGNEQAAFRSARSYLGQGLNASITPFTTGKKFKIPSSTKKLCMMAKKDGFHKIDYTGKPGKARKPESENNTNKYLLKM